MSAESDILVVDSESENETPPKTQRHETRKRGRGRRKTQTSRSQAGGSRNLAGGSRRCTRKRAQERETDDMAGCDVINLASDTNQEQVSENNSVILIDDTNLQMTSLITVDTTSESVSLGTDEVSDSPVPLEINPNATCISSDLTDNDDKTVHETDPTASNSDIRTNTQTHKKTARRGLARKHVSSQDSTSSTNTPTEDAQKTLGHQTSVYSECVPQGFKTFFQLAEVEESLSSCRQKEANKERSSMRKKVLKDKEESTSEENASESESKNEDQTSQVADDETLTVQDTPVKIRSPTPPPQTSRPRRPVKGMTKKLSSAFRALTQAKVSLDKKTPPRRKRRGPDSDLILVEDDLETDSIMVKIRYLATVHRFKMKITESFHEITEKMSQLLGEPNHKLSLYLGDQSLHPSDTPKSVKMTVADIIECHCIEADNAMCRPCDVINLLIQSNNRTKPMTITTSKRQPLSEVMVKYAESIGRDWSEFVFSFDGEDILPQDTASKLDMDNDDVIDVRLR